jgi:hypothetical protein
MVWMTTTYNGGDGKGILLSIFKETEHIIPDDDARLAGQYIEDTHYNLRGLRRSEIFSFVGSYSFIPFHTGIKNRT